MQDGCYEEDEYKTKLRNYLIEIGNLMGPDGVEPGNDDEEDIIENEYGNIPTATAEFTELEELYEQDEIDNLDNSWSNDFNQSTLRPNSLNLLQKQTPRQFSVESSQHFEITPQSNVGQQSVEQPLPMQQQTTSQLVNTLSSQERYSVASLIEKGPQFKRRRIAQVSHLSVKPIFSDYV